MAEETQDQSQKTEEPTQKRLEDSRQKGQVANSREVNNWIMILAGTVVVMLFAPAMMRDMRLAMLKFIEKPHAMRLDAAQAGEVLVDLFLNVGVILLTPMLILFGAALATGLVQSGLIMAPERIKPKLDKISLISGVKRLFSMRSLTEFAKGLFKISVVGFVATMLMLPEFASLDQIPKLEVSDMLGYIHGLIGRLLIGVLSIITVIAALDFLYQKFEHLKQNRMSRQEIKDEMKQTEGDPMVKQRLRQIRHDRARKRMMAAVPEASVVITNPTHFAVALKYELDEMSAPILIAKGVDHLAFRIREIAREADVPIVENPPLAQALYAGVEIDDQIPPEHYKAVAEIIGYVLRLKGKMRAN
jgi:flagellar biosynthetic protein FlhB